MKKSPVAMKQSPDKEERYVTRVRVGGPFIENEKAVPIFASKQARTVNRQLP
ncbi:hypothetical protein D3C71_1979490 [compost metagenome]